MSTRAPAQAAVEAARALDQEGVRAYRDARYTDAAAYFRAAYQAGGPSSELWNIVRCKERMDDAEGAADEIDAYLGAKDLQPQDRAEAQREAQALRTRSSAVTVVTRPPGATVTVDGRLPSGATPVSFEVRSGAHTIAVRRDGYVAESREIEARFGRAVIVTLDLARPSK